nr:thioredoxin domain-containing protein [uncultured Desulfobacter sp.]
MKQNAVKKKIVGIIIILGAVTAILSTLETRVAWISSFCGVLGDGCRETVQYSILNIGVSYWGVAFYAFLGMLYLFRPTWLFFAVMAGCGVETVMVILLIQMKLVCILCLMNLAWMLLLLYCFFDFKRFSQMLCVWLVFYVSGGGMVRPPDTGHDPGGSCHESPQIMARVGGTDITRQQVEQPLTTKLYKMQSDIYRVKHTALENRINQVLLEKDAREKGISVQALKDRLVAELPAVKAAAVDFYFKTGIYKRWGSWRGSEAETREKIRLYLRLSAEEEKILAHCQTLRQRYPVTVFLEKPSLPMTRVSIDGCPSTGPDHATVIVVEVSDYLCPMCRKGHDTLERVRQAYKEKIKWVFKANPLESIHPGATDVALAGRCAGEQGKFWEFHQMLFSGKKPGVDDARKYAKQLGLDMGTFDACLADANKKEQFGNDREKLRKAGVTSTPTLIINGKVQVGVPSYEALCQMIDQALNESAKTTGGIPQ